VWVRCSRCVAVCVAARVAARAAGCVAVCVAVCTRTRKLMYLAEARLTLSRDGPLL